MRIVRVRDVYYYNKDRPFLFTNFLTTLSNILPIFFTTIVPKLLSIPPECSHVVEFFYEEGRARNLFIKRFIYCIRKLYTHRYMNAYLCICIITHVLYTYMCIYRTSARSSRVYRVRLTYIIVL